MNRIPLHVQTGAKVGLHVRDDSLSLKAGGQFYAVGSQPYEGAYTLTPTEQTQVIPINGLRALDDLTINPIPNNYGLITYNGSTIRVS